MIKKNLAAQRLLKSFDQTFLKVWPPAGPPEAFFNSPGTISLGVTAPAAPKVFS